MPKTTPEKLTALPARVGLWVLLMLGVLVPMIGFTKDHELTTGGTLVFAGIAVCATFGFSAIIFAVRWPAFMRYALPIVALAGMAVALLSTDMTKPNYGALMHAEQQAAAVSYTGYTKVDGCWAIPTTGVSIMADGPNCAIEFDLYHNSLLVLPHNIDLAEIAGSSSEDLRIHRMVVPKHAVLDIYLYNADFADVAQPLPQAAQWQNAGPTFTAGSTRYTLASAEN